MQSQFKRLLTDFEVTYSAEQISHSAERGRLLETTLVNFFSTVFPKRIGIGTGQVVDAPGKEPSRQIDIVLHDAINYPLLLKEPGYQLFINESVLSVIEVKSKLNKKYLEEGITNINSARGLLKFPPKEHPQTLGGLFCYETTWKKPMTLFKNIQELTKADPAKAPDIICSLDPPYLVVSTNILGLSVTRMATPLAGMEKDNKYPSDKFLFIQPLQKSFSEHILLWFYLLLMDYLNRVLNIGVNMSQYIKSPSAWNIHEVDLADLSFS